MPVLPILSPLDLPLDPPSIPYTLTHHQTKRNDGSSDTSTNIVAMIIGFFIPILLASICCCFTSKSKKNEQKKRELDETIDRSIRLHAEICRDEGGGCRGSELSDSEVAEIAREVRRELGRLHPAVGGGPPVGSQDESTVDEGRDEAGSVIEEPPPAYKPRG